VGTTSGLDVLEERNISGLYRDSNPGLFFQSHSHYTAYATPLHSDVMKPRTEPVDISRRNLLQRS